MGCLVIFCGALYHSNQQRKLDETNNQIRELQVIGLQNRFTDNAIAENVLMDEGREMSQETTHVFSPNTPTVWKGGVLSRFKRGNR
eukprot:UN00223